MFLVKNKLLLVDGDEKSAALVASRLAEFGFKITVAASGEYAFQKADVEQPALILSEVSLPDISGFELISRIKRNPFTQSLPVIFHTDRGDDVDRIVGLELGAEDYVQKPCNSRELALRIKRAINRVSRNYVPEEELRVGELSVIRSKAEVRVLGKEVRMAATEFKLLVVLMERAGRLQSRERLFADVWGYSPLSNSRTLDSHIKIIRRKLGPIGHYIETVRNLGFRIKECPVDPFPVTQTEFTSPPEFSCESANKKDLGEIAV